MFIFIPILFHAAVGWLIISGAVPNTGSYPYASNIRYTLQRVTGIIAFFFILVHVIHLHHFGQRPFGSSAAPVRSRPRRVVGRRGASRRRFGCRSSTPIGMLACVYHFANGIWTLGITWGIWTSAAAPAAGELRSASSWASVLAVGRAERPVGHDRRVDVDEAMQVEDRMIEAHEDAKSGELPVE